MAILSKPHHGETCVVVESDVLLLRKAGAFTMVAGSLAETGGFSATGRQRFSLRCQLVCGRP